MLLALLMILSQAQPAPTGPDVLGVHRINALRGLRTVAVVVRPNLLTDVVSVKELIDFGEVDLHQKAPELRLVKDTNAPSWIELSVATTTQGALVEVKCYRWVRLSDSAQQAVFAPVWSNVRAVFGSETKAYLQGVLDELLVSFAADYERARR
jgi:hypothetical protein